MKKETKKTPVVLYARAAPAVQDHDCVENQLSMLKKYARKNGYAVIQTYADNGYSGTTLDRPGLNSLREDAKESLWKYVLVCSPTRLARGYFILEALSSELEDLGIEAVCLNNDAESALMTSLHGFFAQYESMKQSELTKAGIRAARNRKIKV